MKINNLIQEALKAIEAEIEAVREKPSQDVLLDGEKSDRQPPGEHYYEFETRNQSIQYAELIKAELDDEDLEIHPVEFDDDTLILNFPGDMGATIDRMKVEWENDFVLRKLNEALGRLIDADDEIAKRMQLLFDTNVEREEIENSEEVSTDHQRNDAQLEAIEKSMRNRVTYVWGPPGTGKTSTLGYIIANYLAGDQSVLFASNTNRAVDVGLLSVLEALHTINEERLVQKATRFGEAALDSPHLNEVLFDHQIEQKAMEQEQKVSQMKSTLDEYQQLQEEADELIAEDKEVPKKLDLRCRMLGDKVDEYGGEDALEEKIADMLSVNELVELKKKKLVATTLAKVCTSELFTTLDFDAVVIDEASMANLPYLLVLAAKARKHIVVVGDPMQLPPIALTDQREAKQFLEQDIFAFVSGAKTTEDLFAWHDQNESITCFFNRQYRLKQDLAQLISSVFYQNRLKSDESVSGGTTGSGSDKTVSVVDSAGFHPHLVKKDSDGGFKPKNEVHLFLVNKLVNRFLMKHAIPMHEIGVIVPFRSAVYDTRDLLREEGYNGVEVGTIHTFQGREKEVIIFDTVMSGELQGGGVRHYSVRPFDEAKNGLSVPRLLNVAFSRSKKYLVIIADMRHINRVYENKFLGDLLNRLSHVNVG